MTHRRTKSPHGTGLKWLNQQASLPQGDCCLYWPFGRCSDGYGSITVNGKKTRAHRVMCQMVSGTPPPGAHALHRCGNGHLGCVNPKHLYWGTPKDNARDASRHGVQPRGVRNGSAKLSESDVLTIRSLLKSGARQPELARAYGVSQSTISLVGNRRRWSHV